MTRIGMNPARHRATSYRPARITVGMLVYLPHQEGYFEHRLDVVKLSLASLIRHTDLEYDLMVFDNASCSEMKAHLHELQQQGVLRYLLSSSENIGKRSALRLMAGAAPGEVLAYADDDTFFYPGWLSAHIALLDGFPNVGMVSGSPERTNFDHATASTVRFGQDDAETQLSLGRRIPDAWERDWAIALGKDPDEFLAQVSQMDEIVLTRRGLEAYGTACHNQFVAPRAVMHTFLGGAWSGRLMGGMTDFDNAVDEAGLLRLTTVDRTTRLIGNVVSPTMEAEARRLGVEAHGQPWGRFVSTRRPALTRFLLWGPVRRILQGLYNRLFWLLSGQSSEWLTRETMNGKEGG